MLISDLERILAIAKDGNKEIAVRIDNAVFRVENHDDCAIEGCLFIAKNLRCHSVVFIEIAAICSVSLTDKGSNDKQKETAEKKEANLPPLITDKNHPDYVRQFLVHPGLPEPNDPDGIRKDYSAKVYEEKYKDDGIKF